MSRGIKTKTIMGPTGLVELPSASSFDHKKNRQHIVQTSLARGSDNWVPVHPCPIGRRHLDTSIPETSNNGTSLTLSGSLRACLPDTSQTSNRQPTLPTPF